MVLFPSKEIKDLNLHFFEMLETGRAINLKQREFTNAHELQ
jgi:hypothetical protein